MLALYGPFYKSQGFLLWQVGSPAPARPARAPSQQVGGALFGIAVPVHV